MTRLDPLSFWQEILTFIGREGEREEERKGEKEERKEGVRKEWREGEKLWYTICLV